MMFTANVITTHGRGLTAEEHASLAREKIIRIAESAPEPIRVQATAFGREIERVIAKTIRNAILSDRTTVYNALVDAGHPELAEKIRRL